MNSPDIHTLTGAYALDALERFERRQFQAHLAQCPDCAREVEELRAAAARLGAVIAEQPPDMLRTKVMAQVATTRQDSPATRAGTTWPRTADGRRAGWAPRLTAAVAALAAAAAVVFGVLTVRTAQQRDAAQDQLARVQARYAPIARVAAAPDAHADSGTGVAGGTAFVIVSHQLNQAVLLVSGLPAPPAGHTYQAWLIADGHPRSVGLVPTTASSVAATAPVPLVFGGLGGPAKVGLTIEPAGGSAQPTTTPVVLFDLPS